MKNPPVTYVVNLMNFCTLISGYSRMMVPTNLAILIPASIMSHFKQGFLAKRYLEGRSELMPWVDFCTHWLPTAFIITHNRRKRIRRRDVMVAALLPWLYFSMGQKSKNKFFFVNPISHLMNVYPGVPLSIFFCYYGSLGFLYNYAMRRKSAKIMYY